MASREVLLTPVAKNDLRALAQVMRSAAVRAARWRSPGAGSDVMSSSICWNILHQQHKLCLNGFDNDDHKPWPWQPLQWRPQSMTMTATTRWPQTKTTKYITWWNFVFWNGITVNSPWIWRFLKSMPSVFTFSLLWPSMVYLVAVIVIVCGAVMVCGRHDTDPVWTLLAG